MARQRFVTSLGGGEPEGPWSAPLPFTPGWAHEVWQQEGGGWATSYLTGYTVTTRPVTWDRALGSPRPFIGERVNHWFLPLVGR